MKIVLNDDNTIFATHDDSQQIEHLYGDRRIFITGNFYEAGQQLSEAEVAGLIGYVANNIDPMDFSYRFTMAERAAIRVAAHNGDGALLDALAMLQRAQRVRLDHDATISYVNYVASLGLIEEFRIAEILG